MDLNRIIRLLASDKRINHLMLQPSRGRWQAALREEGGSGYRIEIRDDPIDALLAVLGPLPGETMQQFLATPHPVTAERIRQKSRTSGR